MTTPPLHTRLARWLLAVAFCSVLLTSSAVAADTSPTDARANASVIKHSRLSATEKKRIQRQLRAELRHPKRIKWRSFARRASLVNFALPVTVRLNRYVDSGPGVAPSDDSVSV